MGSITQPLPSSYLIFRAASESDGEFSPALRVSRPPPEAGGPHPWGLGQVHGAPVQALPPRSKEAA